MAEEPKVISWSYSAMSTFETCPRQYQAKYVTKEVPYQQNAAAKWGDDVHKALEENIKTGKPLPSNMVQYQKFLDAVKFRADKLKGELLAEKQVALTKDLESVSWFTKKTAKKPVWFRTKIDVTVHAGGYGEVYDWKGLPLGTPLPTPTGWTTIGEVAVGDTVVGGDGKPCKVYGKSAVHNKACWEITFDDTSKVVCDFDHKWLTNFGVLETHEVVRRRDAGSVITIPVVEALELPEQNLPIPPYLLGLWLADGKHTSGEITKPDKFIWEHIGSLGLRVSSDYSRNNGKCRGSTVYGLRTELRKLGLLGNKHIPQQYLRASVAQRTELLRGLMDGDGNANPARQQCVFTNCDKGLSEQVQELLLSLGQRPLLSTVTATGFGKTVQAHPVSFRPSRGLMPFRLPRKADQVQGWRPGRAHLRRFKSISPVESVPTQCIAVDSPDNTYLCTHKMLTTHNTGKRKFDRDQLHLYAMVAFILYPELERVKAGFIWLKDGVVDKPVEYTREQLPDMLAYWHEKYEVLEEAWILDDFPPKPSGLCRGWCEVTTCPHWQPKRG